MISVSQHLTPMQASQLRTTITQLDEAYWRDRSRHKPNVGMDGKPGQYHSCGRVACPESLRQQVDNLAPDYPGLMLEDWIINWTKPGGGLPPHIDNEGYLGIAVLCLQSGSGAFVWYQNNDLKQAKCIEDKAGKLIQFNDITQIHAVPPALTNRYVIVFLYR